MEIMLLLFVPMLVLLIYVTVKAILIIYRDHYQTEKSTSRNSLFLGEFIFLGIAPILGFLRYDGHGNEIPFAKEHILSIQFLSFVSIGCYFIARFYESKLTKLQKGLLSVGIMQGMIICFFTSIHFLSHIFLGIVFPMFGFELAAPYMGFVLLLVQFYFLNKKGTDYRISNTLNRFEAQMTQNKFVSFSILLIFLIGAEILVLMCFGQDSDSLIRAFHESKGFIFSFNKSQPFLQ